MSASPLFIIIEPEGAAAADAAETVSWASSEAAGVADAAEAAGPLGDALGDVAGVAFVGDYLFDPPRLAALGLVGTWRDWLLALAPFNQARNLAAIMETAQTRADPLIPATRLLEAWREAKRRAEPPS